MIEIFKEFTFDAAHHLAGNVSDGHPYSRMHGHSFRARVCLRGNPDAKAGWVMDFEEVQKILLKLHDELDHRCLNDIPGLEVPTLETLCQWIWNKLKPQMPSLYRITVWRGTLGEGCSFEG